MEDDGWRELIEYGGCAAGMFLAVTPPMILAAALNCARLFAAESW